MQYTLRALAAPSPSSISKQICVPSRRDVGIKLVDLRRACEVHGVRAVGIHHEQLPVRVLVGFVDDLVGEPLEFLEQVLARG